MRDVSLAPRGTEVRKQETTAGRGRTRSLAVDCCKSPVTLRTSKYRLLFLVISALARRGLSKLASCLFFFPMENTRAPPCGLQWRKLVELFRKNDSRFYWYDLKIRGKRYRGSTKETNKKKAGRVGALR